MSRLAILTAVALAAAALSSADAPKPAPRAEALDLLLLNGIEPARLELRVEIDGKSVPAVWDETFAKLLAFCDRDGNGALDKAEAGRAPSAFALRQALWGQFTPFAGDAPPFADLDRNGDGKVSGEELADFYRRAGLGGVLVGVGKPTATDQLTDALLKHLDANKDGKVDAAEWKGAADALRKLDANDDELVGPGELVEKLAYPGAIGAILVSAPPAAARPDPTLDALPFVVLPLRTGDTNWVAAVAARRERAKATPIPTDALAALRTSAPATAWQVRLGTREKDAAPLNEAGGKSPTSDRLALTAAGVRLELRADDGKLKEQTAAARKRFTVLFAECDTNADGSLDEKETGVPKAAPFKHISAIAGRTDGKLSEKELAAWLDLQEQVAKGHAMLSVLDHGQGLFEFLDADHDGSLSVRELRTAWDRLNAAGCVTDGALDRTKLPRQLLAAVSHGHPQTALGKPARGGPEWFKAMDRNGDGDVSRREFTGKADVFDKLDLDKDGLLSPDEAEKADAKK